MTKSDADGPDLITPNVGLTRGSSQGLYNGQQEGGFTHYLSPIDTEWANGTIANYATLSYTDWNTWAKGVNPSPPSTVGVDAVVHLKTDNIYIAIKFLSWSVGGTYSYERSTPAAANVPPSVAITSPANGASFVAPAVVTVTASASDSDGTVANVEFFDGLTSLGSVASSPYNLTVGLGAGSHTLTAVATDNQGATTTSTPVTVTVTIALTITSIADKGLATTINWAGGVGPFLLQKKLSLSDAAWWNVLTTSNHSVTVAKEDPRGFFRVLNQAQTTVSPFTVLLNGPSEIPAVTTPATALGTISIESNLFTYHISFSGLSSPAFAAHVHGAADATQPTGVLFPLNGASGTSGVLSGTHTLTSTELQDITNGLAYVNIHTANNGGGEIRGQIVPLQLTAALNGASEVPPITTSATGTASLTMIGSQLSYVVTYSGLTSPATASHIHGPADVAHSTGVLVPLNTPTGTSGTISGTLSLTPQVLADVLAGLTYINIHTTINGGGEIRGQITR